MYNKSVWKSKNNRFIIIKKYHSFKVQACGPMKETRGRRLKNTGLKQSAINARIRRDRLERLLLDNFQAGDCYMTCTYRDKPESEEQVRADWARFKRKLKSFFTRKLDLVFKFIAILENLHGGGRPHGHILIPQIPAECIRAVKKLWPHGNMEIKAYGGELMDAHRLAGYFTKEKVSEESSAVQSSRNLIRTEPKKTIVSKSDTYSERMAAPAGYHIVQELSYLGYTDEGFPLMKMVLERDDEDVHPPERRKNGKGVLSKTNKLLRKTKSAVPVGAPGGGVQ